jgi:hypothetical protein
MTQGNKSIEERKKEERKKKKDESEDAPIPVPPGEEPPAPIKEPPPPVEKPPIEDGPKGPKKIVARSR